MFWWVLYFLAQKYLWISFDILCMSNILPCFYPPRRHRHHYLLALFWCVLLFFFPFALTCILRNLAGVVDIKYAFHLYYKCGLSFSRSQPDFEGFLRALRFPSSSKSTPSLIHLAVVLCSEVIHGSCSGLERLAGSTAPSVQPRWPAPFAIQSTTARKGRLASQIL